MRDSQKNWLQVDQCNSCENAVCKCEIQQADLSKLAGLTGGNEIAMKIDITESCNNVKIEEECLKELGDVAKE